VKNYLALGTSLNYGEEVYVRGRVVLFELIEVVPEEGMPTSKLKFDHIYAGSRYIDFFFGYL
jgi:cleavage and polyadenylation specificity factor subunit 1